MRVFVCEFVTGGGMRDEALSPSLAREGAMMRDALVRDLSDLGWTVVTTHDDRMRPAFRAESTSVAKGGDAWRLWRDLAAGCDAAWLVAPETGGALARLTALARDACGEVVGPDEDAIRIASSKTLTAERLLSRGVKTPPVWRPGETPADASGPFVSKPDDGAGCEATRFWDVLPDPADVSDTHILQTFAAGTPASLSVITTRAGTRLLSVNHQHVTIEDGAFAFRGLSIAGLGDADGRLAALAEHVAAALPGLSGIYGVDVVLGPTGPVVIEINPRLTTAYAGLRQALGFNPAALVPPFAGPETPPQLSVRQIEIAL